MFSIVKYLEKFKETIELRGFVTRSVRETIMEVCKIDVEERNIKIRNGVIRINEGPMVKTEIFFKKIKILEILSKKTNGRVWKIL